eukprot:FR742599.1.p1 GENE.FR742599.1~~FR742599.1.p1  ORF type:complete len:264 (+),score=19.47 FR742599.1:100-792(+)
MGTCDYLGPARAGRPCAYFAILRDPVDRLISEHNWCREVKWIGDQTCSGPAGAGDLKRTVNAKGLSTSAGFIAFANARGNVLLEHFAHSFALADFGYKDHPYAWHDRNAYNRITPMETRRNRQGDSNEADLAAAEFFLAHHFSVVGLMEEFETSVKRITKVLTGKEIPAEIFNLPEMHAHDSTQRNQTKGYVYRENLDEQALHKVRKAVALDLKLYAFAKKCFESFSSPT